MPIPLAPITRITTSNRLTDGGKFWNGTVLRLPATTSATLLQDLRRARYPIASNCVNRAHGALALLLQMQTFAFPAARGLDVVRYAGATVASGAGASLVPARRAQAGFTIPA